MLELKTYKSWREICSAMGWDTTGGSYKKARLKKLESLCSFDRLGNKYIIKEIYDTPKDIEDGRGKSCNNKGKGKNINKLLSYGISYEDMNKKGIYAIILDNKIYIGSTINNFLSRYGQHKEKRNLLKTRDMLEQGATFKILQICEHMTEEQVRVIEDNWIKEYRNNSQWEVINKTNVKIKGKRKPKPKVKYKKVKINELDYSKAIELLTKNGIDLVELK